MMSTDYIDLFLKESIESIKKINQKQIEKLIITINKVRS